MIFVDVETSGLDSKKCSLLSIGAIDFDNPKNQFYEECRVFSGAHVEREALQVNGFTENDARDFRKKTDEEIVRGFLRWAGTCKEWTFAGQNISFDRDFIKETCHRYHVDWPFAQRTIDLHSVVYAELLRIGKGSKIPVKNNHSDLNLDKIIELAGLEKRSGIHNGLEDAKLEAEAFSRIIYGKNLLEEYKIFPVKNI